MAPSLNSPTSGASIPHLVLTALPWWCEGGVARRGVWVQGGKHPHPQTSHIVPLVNTVLCCPGSACILSPRLGVGGSPVDPFLGQELSSMKDLKEVLDPEAQETTLTVWG